MKAYLNILIPFLLCSTNQSPQIVHTGSLRKLLPNVLKIKVTEVLKKGMQMNEAA